MIMSWRRASSLELSPNIFRLVHLGGGGRHWPLAAYSSDGSNGGVHEHGYVEFSGSGRFLKALGEV